MINKKHNTTVKTDTNLNDTTTTTTDSGSTQTKQRRPSNVKPNDHPRAFRKKDFLNTVHKATDLLNRPTTHEETPAPTTPSTPPPLPAAGHQPTPTESESTPLLPAESIPSATDSTTPAPEETLPQPTSSEFIPNEDFSRPRAPLVLTPLSKLIPQKRSITLKEADKAFEKISHHNDQPLPSISLDDLYNLVLEKFDQNTASRLFASFNTQKSPSLFKFPSNFIPLNFITSLIIKNAITFNPNEPYFSPLFLDPNSSDLRISGLTLIDLIKQQYPHSAQQIIEKLHIQSHLNYTLDDINILQHIDKIKELLVQKPVEQKTKKVQEAKKKQKAINEGKLQDDVKFFLEDNLNDSVFYKFTSEHHLIQKFKKQITDLFHILFWPNVNLKPVPQENFLELYHNTLNQTLNILYNIYIKLGVYNSENYIPAYYVPINMDNIKDPSLLIPLHDQLELTPSTPQKYKIITIKHSQEIANVIKSQHYIDLKSQELTQWHIDQAIDRAYAFLNAQKIAQRKAEFNALIHQFVSETSTKANFTQEQEFYLRQNLLKKIWSSPSMQYNNHMSILTHDFANLLFNSYLEVGVELKLINPLEAFKHKQILSSKKQKPKEIPLETIHTPFLVLGQKIGLNELRIHVHQNFGLEALQRVCQKLKIDWHLNTNKNNHIILNDPLNLRHVNHFFIHIVKQAIAGNVEYSINPTDLCNIINEHYGEETKSAIIQSFDLEKDLTSIDLSIVNFSIINTVIAQGRTKDFISQHVEPFLKQHLNNIEFKHHSKFSSAFKSFFNNYKPLHSAPWIEHTSSADSKKILLNAWIQTIDSLSKENISIDDSVKLKFQDMLDTLQFNESKKQK